MGNPHPTKSKPIKIGRKHTGAISNKVKQKRQNIALNRSKEQKRLIAKWNQEVAAYWRGERDTHPGPGPK